MTIDFLIAREKARSYLTRLSMESEGEPYAIIDSRIREDEDGWYFPYQSEKFVLSGNFDDSLVGNWPIFVGRNDDCVGPRHPGMAFPKTD